jgi:hypothetical protein
MSEENYRTGYPIMKRGLRIMRAGHALVSEHPTVIRHSLPYLWHYLRAQFRRRPSNDLRTYAHLSRTYDRYYYLTLPDASQAYPLHALKRDNVTATRPVWKIIATFPVR